jgi:hypothetical protein
MDSIVLGLQPFRRVYLFMLNPPRTPHAWILSQWQPSNKCQDKAGWRGPLQVQLSHRGPAEGSSTRQSPLHGSRTGLPSSSTFRLGKTRHVMISSTHSTNGDLKEKSIRLTFGGGVQLRMITLHEYQLA